MECPDRRRQKSPWVCDHCYYKHPDPVEDPFYQSTVKNLMYLCAVILLFVSLLNRDSAVGLFNLTLVVPNRLMVLSTNPRVANMAEPSTATPTI